MRQSLVFRPTIVTAIIFAIALIVVLIREGVSAIAPLSLLYGVQLLAVAAKCYTPPVWAAIPVTAIQIAGFPVLQVLPVSEVRRLWPIIGLLIWLTWAGYVRDFGIERYKQYRDRASDPDLFRPPLVYYLPSTALATLLCLIYALGVPVLEGTSVSESFTVAGLGILVGAILAFIGGPLRYWLGLLGAFIVGMILLERGHDAIPVMYFSWLATYVVACHLRDPGTTYIDYLRPTVKPRAKDKSIPAYFDSEAEAEQFRQSVPALELSTVTVSITAPRRVNPNTPKSSLVKVSYQFATDTETVVFSASDIDDAADAIADPDSLVVCGNGPFLSSSGFPGSHAEELRQKYGVLESHLALSSEDGKRIIATLTPTDRHQLGQWLETITTNTHNR